jgi:hypothetical protein
MRHFLTPRWGWTSLCSCLPTACAVGFILTPLCGWTPGFGHAFVRLTPCGLHSCAPLGLDLALLMPPHGLRRGLYSYAALRRAPGRFLKNAAVRILALAVENTSLLPSRYFALLSKYFPLVVEMLRFCRRNTSLLEVEILLSCYRNTSRLVAPPNYPVGDDRPETS